MIEGLAGLLAGWISGIITGFILVRFMLKKLYVN